MYSLILFRPAGMSRTKLPSSSVLADWPELSRLTFAWTTGCPEVLNTRPCSLASGILTSA